METPSIRSNAEVSIYFGCIKQDYDTRSIAKAIEEGRITEEDADLIVRFISDRKVTKDIGIRRAHKITFGLVAWRRFIGPFLDNSISDIYRGVDSMKRGKNAKGNAFSSQTKYDFVSVLKTFYRWLIDENLSDIPEKKILAIKSPARENTKTADDLLSPEEIRALLNACTTIKDKALISTLYEGGFRIGEIGQMRWRDLKFDGTGVAISTTFKTGKTRYIRLVMAKEHLIKLKSEYPGEPSGDNFVFLNRFNNPYTYPAIAKQLRRIAERSGINRDFTPHIFRHSRITHLAQSGVNESVIKLMMWGSLQTKEFATYAHLTGGDIDKEVFKLYGIEPIAKQVTEEQLEPRLCPRCREPNSSISRHCHICGTALTGDVIETDQEVQEFFFNHKDAIKEYLDSLANQTDLK
jgi:integrase/recombinase XerD